MNCYNHIKKPAVATCVSCGKGLCEICSDFYAPPICNQCALKYINNQNSNFISQYVITGVVIFTGIVLGIQNNHNLLAGLFLGYMFASIYWGWKILSSIQPQMFLFLPLIGWLFYFTVKLTISISIGFIAVPFGILDLIQKQKKNKEFTEYIFKNINSCN
jgi:hypothetical protein